MILFLVFLFVYNSLYCCFDRRVPISTLVECLGEEKSSFNCENIFKVIFFLLLLFKFIFSAFRSKKWAIASTLMSAYAQFFFVVNRKFPLEVVNTMSPTIPKKYALLTHAFYAKIPNLVIVIPSTWFFPFYIYFVIHRFSSVFFVS